MRHVLLSIGAALVLAGCTEPRAVVSTPAPPLSARVIWSDPTAAPGSTIIGVVRLEGTAAASVASFTARISYDSTALRYADDVALGDSTTRVSNPQPGLVRVAGVSANGFAGGQLYAARFILVKRDALATVHVTFDELHTANRAEVRVP